MQTTQTALSPVLVGFLGSTGFPALSQDDAPAGLIVDGNPLENIDLIADPANNFVVIMGERS